MLSRKTSNIVFWTLLLLTTSAVIAQIVLDLVYLKFIAIALVVLATLFCIVQIYQLRGDKIDELLKSFLKQFAIYGLIMYASFCLTKGESTYLSQVAPALITAFFIALLDTWFRVNSQRTKNK